MIGTEINPSTNFLSHQKLNDDFYLNPSAISSKKSFTLPLQAITVIPPVTENSTQATVLKAIALGWNQLVALQRESSISLKHLQLKLAMQQLFSYFLNQVSKIGDSFQYINDWFNTPTGDLLQENQMEPMIQLVESCIQNHWMNVLKEPATVGLINECILHWEQQQKYFLIRSCLFQLIKNLQSTPTDRLLALNHLQDSRPWIKNPRWVHLILKNLIIQLSKETDDSLYQTELLLIWDLLDMAIQFSMSKLIFHLFFTFHSHIENDQPATLERRQMIRVWLLKKLNPILIQKIIFFIQQTRKAIFPPYSNVTSINPFLPIDDCLSETIISYLNFIPEIRNRISSVLLDMVADVKTEEELLKLFPVFGIFGIDLKLSFQLFPWVAQGSTQLKLNLIQTIEASNDFSSELLLKLLLLDDSEEMVIKAIQALGYAGREHLLPLIFKVIAYREHFNRSSELILISTCQMLGDLLYLNAIPFLTNIILKKRIFHYCYSTLVRKSALEALVKINNRYWTSNFPKMDSHDPLKPILDGLLKKSLATNPPRIAHKF
jgi:hypothetical protein